MDSSESRNMFYKANCDLCANHPEDSSEGRHMSYTLVVCERHVESNKNFRSMLSFDPQSHSEGSQSGGGDLSPVLLGVSGKARLR